MDVNTSLIGLFLCRGVYHGNRKLTGKVSLLFDAMDAGLASFQASRILQSLPPMPA